MDGGADLEERWKEWQRKGRQREAALRRKQLVATSVAFLLGAIYFYLTSYTTVLR
jgi:hypothetical protein